MPVLRIRCLGPLEVTDGGEPLVLPPSKKTRALLGYLAVSGRAHARSRVMALFWDEASDPRGGLRWSLSRLRAVLGDRLETEGQTLRVAEGAVEVDVGDVRKDPAALARLDTAELERLASMFRGELLEGLDLDELHTFHAWLIAERDALRRVHVDLLTRLTERLRDEPARALPYARARLAATPHDPEAHVSLVEFLRANGDLELAAAQVEASRRQLKDAGVAASAMVGLGRPAAPSPPPPAAAPIRFCQSRDGTRLAYAVAGEGPVLVKTSHWLSHLEYDRESPVWRHWVRELSRDRTLVRFDQRGHGMSERDVLDLGVDRMVEDLEAVVDAVGLQRFPLLGVSQGGAYAVAFAARYPERVSKLVLYGAFPRLRFTGGATGPGPAEPFAALIENGWGQDNPAIRQLFTTLFLPKGTREQHDWFNELQARTASPPQAARQMRALGVLDVGPLLAQVRVPTLVIHARGDSVASYRSGLALASGIPGARMVSLEGHNHVILEDEPAWPQFLAAMRRFLDDDAA